MKEETYLEYALKKLVQNDIIILTLGNYTYPFLFRSAKLQKGGSVMEQKVNFDYRPYVALGVILVMGVLAVRMPVESTENAFNHLVDAAFKVQPLSLDCGH